MNVTQSSMVAVAVALAASLDECGVLPDFRDSTSHGSIGKGNIVGRDYGKGRKKQPRNSLCLCGSGIKAKRCCVWIPEPQKEDTGE